MNGRLAGTLSGFGRFEIAAFQRRQWAGCAAAQEETAPMAKDSIAGLVAQLYGSKISRREFGKRAAAAGLTASLVGQALAVHATRAQSPEAGGEPASTTIGEQGYVISTDTSKGTIKIYSSWPLTGTMEGTGGDAVVAAQMAFEDFGNAAGGFAIVYEPLDDGVAANNGGWEAGQETANVNKAINDADAMVLMGTYNSGAAKIAIPLLNQVQPAGMAMISFANTGVGLTVAVEGATDPGEPDLYYPTGKRNYCRVCPQDYIQGSASGRWAYNTQNLRKAYVLDDNSYYGKGVATVFKNTFEELGGEILGAESFDKGLDNYQTLMTSIADKGPDVVYVGATVENNAAKVLQDMRGVMSVDDVVFLGSDGMNSKAFIDGAGDAADGAYLTFGGYTPDKLLANGGPGGDFVTRVTDKLGHSPDAYSVYSYESVVAVIQAIARAGEKDRGTILDQLMGTKEFVALGGYIWSFDANGDIDNGVIGLSKVIDNTITFQEAIS
jgi:branched-chain amino acid transport system substrate-binding protein